MPRPHAVYPGWRVVAGVCLQLTAVSGFGFYSLTVYLHVLVTQRGFDLAAVSGATSVFFLLSGLFNLPVASMLSRYGERRVMALGGLVMTVALLLLGQVHNTGQMYAVYALFGLANSAVGPVPGQLLVARWFSRRRSFALALATTGLSIGGIAVAPGVAAATQHRTLGTVAPWLAAAFAVAVAVSIVLIRTDPAVHAERFDELRPLPGRAATEDVSLRDAVRTRLFLLATVSQLFALLAQVGGMSHIYNLGADRVGTAVAATAVSVVAFASFSGRFVGSLVMRRMTVASFGVLMLVLQAVGAAALGFATSTGPLLTATAVFGLTIGNVLLIQPLLFAEAFGVRDYARIVSWSQLAATAGIATGPSIVGLARDHTGSYTSGFVIVACSSLLGAAAMWATGRAQRRSVLHPTPIPPAPSVVGR